jgi:hypothetical protein
MREEWEFYGVCGKCKALVSYGEERTHGCRTYFTVDYLTKINPTQNPWLPGFRFGLGQDSQKVGRTGGRMRTRVYHVSFVIDHNGILKHAGGVKPTAATMARAEKLYAENRPGSNYYPGWDDL